jgi:SAM-dependent methyltransferase
MKEMWDQRFAGTEYAYGTAPNAYFKSRIDVLEPGTIFLPAEGEGRNAVYSAKLGWTVTAIDYSVSGREKALKLANILGVSIDYRNGSLLEMDDPGIQYDAIGMVFIHFLQEERIAFHKRLEELLKPGGWLILELFHKDQINNDSGGPPNIDMLYTVDIIQQDFPSIHFDHIEKAVIDLNEGQFHKGEAVVVRAFGQKI